MAAYNSHWDDIKLWLGINAAPSNWAGDEFQTLPNNRANAQMEADKETARRQMMKDADLSWAYQPNISGFAPKSPGDVGGYVQYGDPRIAGPIVSPYAPANQAALYGGAEVGDITTVPGADFLKKRQKRGLMGWA